MRSEFMNKDLVLRLSPDEALVCFDFLSRVCLDRKLSIEHESEVHVPISLLCELERDLVAPLSENYGTLLAAARESLAISSVRPAPDPVE